MSASANLSAPRQLIRESLRIAGEKVSRDRVIEVRHPFSGALVRPAGSCLPAPDAAC